MLRAACAIQSPAFFSDATVKVKKKMKKKGLENATRVENCAENGEKDAKSVLTVVQQCVQMLNKL